MHTGEMDCGQRKKRKGGEGGYILNRFHGSVSNKYCGDKRVQHGY